MKSIDEAFEGVYCFDAEELKKARTHQKEKKSDEALTQYETVIKKYEAELTGYLSRKVKGSIAAISPLCIVEEDEYEAGLKQRAGIEELTAKIYLAKGMMSEIKGEDPKESLTKASMHYEKLGQSLKSLGYTCDECEDVAQIMFECEAESAHRNASIIRKAYEIV